MPKITLRDYNDTVKPVTYLWLVGFNWPAGQDFIHDTDAEDEDYCDLPEKIDELGLWDLTGEVVEGRWEWDGEGTLRDNFGGTIYNVKAI